LWPVTSRPPLVEDPRAGPVLLKAQPLLKAAVTVEWALYVT
jgi:hypothetical protein